MIALVLVQTVILVILSILVAGLLRAYATVLRRLNELAGDPSTAEVPFRTVAGLPSPTARLGDSQEWPPAHNLEGIGLSGEVVSVRTVGVGHDTVIAFLSSGCAGCVGFWEELAVPKGWSLPGGGRLVVVTKGPEEESPALLQQLAAPGVDLVMSSAAWTDYAVPGSPFVMVVDGRSGRVAGQGTGRSFSQVGGLIAQAVGDLGPVGHGAKPAADRDREYDVDRVLLRAGILPGDSSLYGDSRP